MSAEQASGSARMATVPVEEELIDLSEWFDAIRRRWKALTLAFVVSSAVGVTVALMIPKEYTASASILPSETKSSAMGLLGQLGGVAGIKVGGRTSMADLFPNVARSRTVAGAMLDEQYEDSTFRAALVTELNLEETGAELEDALMRHIAQSLNVSVDPLTSYASVSYTSHDPRLAAALVNEVVRYMDEFFRMRMKVDSRNESELIMQRLSDERDSLRVAEQRLLDFRERNRAFQLSPTALLEQERLMREVEIHSTLFIELTKQYEIARIDGYRTSPVLTVLDWALPPTKKSGPKRSLYALLIAFLGTAGTFVLIRLREIRNGTEARPQRADQPNDRPSDALSR